MGASRSIACCRSISSSGRRISSWLACSAADLPGATAMQGKSLAKQCSDRRPHPNEKAAPASRRPSGSRPMSDGAVDIRGEARARAYAEPLETLNPAQPLLFADDELWPYFERLRAED